MVIQWNLRVKDTLGPGILSLIGRMSYLLEKVNVWNHNMFIVSATWNVHVLYQRFYVHTYTSDMLKNSHIGQVQEKSLNLPLLMLQEASS